MELQRAIAVPELHLVAADEVLHVDAHLLGGLGGCWVAHQPAGAAILDDQCGRVAVVLLLGLFLEDEDGVARDQITKSLRSFRCVFLVNVWHVQHDDFLALLLLVVLVPAVLALHLAVLARHAAGVLGQVSQVVVGWRFLNDDR